MRQESVIRLEGGFTVHATGDSAANQAAAGEVGQVAGDQLKAQVVLDFARLLQARGAA